MSAWIVYLHGLRVRKMRKELIDGGSVIFSGGAVGMVIFRYFILVISA